MSLRDVFGRSIHMILKQTIKLSSSRHSLGLTKEQKLSVEVEIEKITESCRVLLEFLGKQIIK